jgi:Tol biopolymer transport system component
VPKPKASGRIVYTTFTLDAARGYEIYAMNSDGTDSIKLTTWGSEPSYSPDGSKVVYYDWMQGGIFTMNVADGSGKARLTNSGYDSYPIWSPAGNAIAFTRADQRGLAVWLMNSDGGGQRRVVDGQQGSWSPDGARLVFKGCVGGDCGLWIINPDGSGRVRLTTNGNDSSPAWSPDGKTIAFGSNRDGNWEIYAMNSDGTNVTRLTNVAASDGIPVWSPDGQMMACRSDRSGVWAVYVMNADGSNVVKLVDANVQLKRWDYERLSWSR